MADLYSRLIEMGERYGLACCVRTCLLQEMEVGEQLKVEFVFLLCENEIL